MESSLNPPKSLLAVFDELIQAKAEYRECSSSTRDNDMREVILRLSVPGKAQKHYSASFDGKFRVSEATAEAVLDLKGNPIALPRYRKYELESLRDSNFLYEVGKTAYPKYPFDTRDESCASGIHGFADLKKAAEYS